MYDIICVFLPSDPPFPLYTYTYTYIQASKRVIEATRIANDTRSVQQRLFEKEKALREAKDRAMAEAR